MDCDCLYVCHAGPWCILYNLHRFEYAPKEDRGYFMAFISAPEGSSLEYTKRNVEKVEQSLVRLLPPNEINQNKGTNEANGVVTIVPGSFSPLAPSTALFLHLAAPMGRTSALRF